jgi:hypothetical protein
MDFDFDGFDGDVSRLADILSDMIDNGDFDPNFIDGLY